MTSWNDMQQNMEAVTKRNAVRDMEQMAKRLCTKENYEKVLAAMPGKGEALDDAGYKKLVRAFADAMKASAAAKAE